MTDQMTLPHISLPRLIARDPATLEHARQGAEEVGFLTLSDTVLTADRVQAVIAAYRAFFHQPSAEKAVIDMARTGSNRGWGAPGAERVDPTANPDYKQVFDSGFDLSPDAPDHLRSLSAYAPNQWPAGMPDFQAAVEGYGADAMTIAHQVLRGVLAAVGYPEGAFDAAFAHPMALLRGNWYPPRPEWATDKDFGIATHTDYGCLTLLATDGSPGLEVRKRGGGWIPVTAPPGTFVINFGEMLERWTERRVRATPHRVIGTSDERISVPLFFNPSYDTNIAPPDAAQPMLAGAYLSRRFAETYVHLMDDAS